MFAQQVTWEYWIIVFWKGVEAGSLSGSVRNLYEQRPDRTFTTDNNTELILVNLMSTPHDFTKLLPVLSEAMDAAVKATRRALGDSDSRNNTAISWGFVWLVNRERNPNLQDMDMQARQTIHDNSNLLRVKPCLVLAAEWV